MSKFVSGKDEIVNNLLMQRNTILKRAGEAVELTCVDVSNHAKAGHAGNMAHANKRYRNQTMQLTHAITPELVEVNFNQIHGIIHTSSVEYAAFVEFGTAINVRTSLPNKPYPYLTPALLANKEALTKRLKNILGK